MTHKQDRPLPKGVTKKYVITIPGCESELAEFDTLEEAKKFAEEFIMNKKSIPITNEGKVQ